jgi:hypothetical protein
LQFCDAVSSNNSEGGHVLLWAALFSLKTVSDFFPKSVRKTPSFTYDFSGFGPIYELKMTAKFRVKNASEKFV